MAYNTKKNNGSIPQQARGSNNPKKGVSFGCLVTFGVAVLGILAILSQLAH